MLLCTTVAILTNIYVSVKTKISVSYIRSKIDEQTKQACRSLVSKYAIVMRSQVATCYVNALQQKACEDFPIYSMLYSLTAAKTGKIVFQLMRLKPICTVG